MWFFQVEETFSFPPPPTGKMPQKKDDMEILTRRQMLMVVDTHRKIREKERERLCS